MEVDGSTTSRYMLHSMVSSEWQLVGGGLSYLTPLTYLAVHPSGCSLQYHISLVEACARALRALWSTDE